MAEWQIDSPSKGCAECEKAFDPGQKYRGYLIDDVKGFLRRDLCDECAAKAEPENVFSKWIGKVPDAEEDNRPRLVDDDLLMDFFKRLQGNSEPRKLQFRYILGLILMRKKLLKFTDVLTVGENEYLVVEERGEKVAHRILDPKLSDEEVEALRHEVGRILTGGDFDDEDDPDGEAEGDDEEAEGLDAEAEEASADGDPAEADTDADEPKAAGD